MHSRLIIKICLLLLIILILILIGHIKNNQHVKYTSVNQRFTIKQNFQKRRKNQNEQTFNDINKSLKYEGKGRDEDSLLGCPFAFNNKNITNVEWYEKSFKQLSPYTEWKRINKYISDSNQKNNQSTNHGNYKTQDDINNTNNYMTNINKITEKSIKPNSFTNPTKTTPYNQAYNQAYKQAYNPPYNQQDRVVIVTPISDAKDKLENYFKIICFFTYPHHLISIILGEDSSGDGTWYEAQAYENKLRGCFNKIEVVQLLGKQRSFWRNQKHSQNYQFHRRRHLAMARNQLVMKAVAENQWVLWIDVDVKHVPADLIQHLLSTNKEIVTVNCLYRMADGSTDIYDRNTWAETEESKKYLESKSENFLMLEGYGPTKRKYLNDLRYVEEEKEYEEVIDDGYGDVEDNGDGGGNGDDSKGGNNNDGIVNENINFNYRLGRNVQKKMSEEELSSNNLSESSSNIEKPKKKVGKYLGENQIKNKLKSIKKITRDLKPKKIKKKKISTPNLLVKLDGVGCCVLLVKADLHRKGLNFPAFIYDHHIETEGLAKMASSIYKVTPYGLPHVYVVHW